MRHRSPMTRCCCATSSAACPPVRWGRSADGTTSSLTIQDAHVPVTDVLNTVRAVVGSTAVTVDIRPAKPDITDPLFTATFPLSVDDQQRVMDVLHKLPVEVWGVTVKNAAIVNLIVGVRDPATTYQDLTTAIAAPGAGPGHTLWLSWRAIGESTSGAPGFAGMVIVGDCNYPHTFGEEQPEKFLTPAALDVQRRLRQQYDTCPK